MATTQLDTVIRHLRRLGTGEPGGPADGQLLERVLADRDETAFAALVRRHGPTVLGVCRRVLRHEHDAEDAFQATFLALVRKARSIARRGSVGGWLYRVAYRAALAARARAAKRAAREEPWQALPAAASTDPVWRDLRPVLDEEVNRLPEKYRVPFVLCYLAGQTTDEAARHLGWPRGTVGTRLAWARDRLRARLTRRGVALSAPLWAAVLAHQAAAAVPAALAAVTVRAALGKAAAGVLSASVAALADAALKTLAAAKLKVAAVVLLAVGAAVGTGALARQAWPAGTSSAASAPGTLRTESSVLSPQSSVHAPA